MNRVQAGFVPVKADPAPLRRSGPGSRGTEVRGENSGATAGGKGPGISGHRGVRPGRGSGGRDADPRTTPAGLAPPAGIGGAVVPVSEAARVSLRTHANLSPCQIRVFGADLAVPAGTVIRLYAAAL